MDWLDYRERLGIGFEDYSKFNLFIVKIENSLQIINKETQAGLLLEEYYRFCNMTGVAINVDVPHYLTGIEAVLRELNNHKKDFHDYLSYVIALINSSENDNYSRCNKNTLTNLVKSSLESCHIKYELLNEGNNIFVFPKGVEAFDNALVSQVFYWLKEYPKTHKRWEKALKAYSVAEEENAGDVADLFRKSLERFFQEFFDGNKSLENYKSEYGSYLKDNGIPAEISGNFETLLQQYTNYMNNYSSKHGAGTHLNILEYLMYQTGNIMRLLITLKTSE